MRPRRLVIRGLRSYRTRQEIDFTDAGLIAILGDTGAGKSSILEALCVALYAASTWDKRNVKALISSGFPTLDVELEFTADGKEWKVHRSLPLGSYPAAMHSLVGITDGTQLNSAREVNERIVELVGLDYDAFLRAVLLPQGRFQALLQATGGERTSILKGIFRLDLLERVRDVARARSDQLGQRLVDLQLRRSKLLDDPATAAEAAEREHAEAARDLARLQTAAAAVRAASETMKELERGAGALEKSAQAVREQDPSSRLDQLTGLIALGRDLEARRAVQVARKSELAAEQGKLSAQVQKAESAGLGLDALLGATRTLADLVDWLAKRDAQLERLEADRHAAAEQAQTLAAERSEVEALDQKAIANEQEVDGSRVEQEAAQKALGQATQRLDAAREAERQRDSRQGTLAQREQGLQACRKELEAATREAKRATAELEKSEAALAAGQRSHAAAYAADGLAAGDACPVCDRKLPASWKAPVVRHLERAQAAVTAAKANERVTRSALTKLEGRAGELEARVKEDRAGLESADESLRASIAALREVAGKKADPRSQGEAALEPLTRQVAAAAKRLDEATRQHRDHEQKRKERHAAVARLAATVEAASKQLDSASLRLGQEGEDANRKLAALALSLRPASLEAKALAAARSRAEEALGTARQNRARDQELSAALRVVDGALSEIEQQRTLDLSRPTNAIGRALDDSRRSLEILAGEIGSDAPPKSDADEPGEVAAWARELVESRDRLLRQAALRAKEVASNLAAAKTAAGKALTQAGVDSEAALTRRATEVAVTVQRQAEDRDIARSQIALAAELDRRIGAGTPLVDALRELARLLTDGKFIGHVVDRKQRSLLVVASKLLGDMTKNRYGFSQDFQVVDRLTGEPRSVMTLSGGETFLASLALALALVELAGREGGRLDALFLDEGFGSLDANALSEALDALHDQAAKGRLVAVISHLHAVAESIERVLRVELTPAGSRAQWLDEGQRAQLLEQEATAGLLI